MKMNKIASLKTEQRNKRTFNFSKLDTISMVETIALEDSIILTEVQKNKVKIAKLINSAHKALKNGGRIVYIGAGTSGRIGMLDASEIYPTYGVKGKIIALIAGGKQAFYEPIEGAEDNKEQAREDLKAVNLNKNDILVGLTASGRTPYVIEALEYAKQIGCKNALICNSLSKENKLDVDHLIFLNTGAEVITGSTRMKAGTSQKMICNILSTAVMTKLGYVRGNYMINVIPSNQKLEQRCKNMIQEITNASSEEIEQVFSQTKNVQMSLYMLEDNLSLSDARKKYEEKYGK
ncbi:N-acetylmuramic acid 6-phosphate etherase [Mycoplasmopsis gallinacea]|uniref:N-acetylmuramic acid 6-phosphate etherase n=1 Tax=Mycoplasmopsis gallinacea TaxID=29556 RepID=A0A6H0V2B5_9BACT|nr:N-acetylmuramic acid 6-phosphate etherase [Mycoplasmopsis gallinacea]QIW62490.1 N-acetylmuramic acid 6-phosphate etherase [Mycoplasmopsis gallinacea]